MTVLVYLKRFVVYVPLFLPFGCLLWQAAFLQLAGSRRHMRTFGLSAYVSAFSLFAGSAFRLGLGMKSSEDAVVLFVVVLVLGACLPFVALLTQEDAYGNLKVPIGANAARFIGTFAYFVCVYLVAEIQTIGGK